MSKRETAPGLLDRGISTCFFVSFLEGALGVVTLNADLQEY